LTGSGDASDRSSPRVRPRRPRHPATATLLQQAGEPPCGSSAPTDPALPEECVGEFYAVAGRAHKPFRKLFSGVSGKGRSVHRKRIPVHRKRSFIHRMGGFLWRRSPHGPAAEPGAMVAGHASDGAPHDWASGTCPSSTGPPGSSTGSVTCAQVRANSCGRFPGAVRTVRGLLRVTLVQHAGAGIGADPYAVAQSMRK